MNISSNPWSFTSADVPAAVVAAASPNGMIQQGTTAGQQGLASVLLTTVGAHGLTAGQYITYVADTNGRFLGFYQVVAVPSATTALLANISGPKNGQPFNAVIAASGGGSVLVCQYPWMVRAEDISLQGTGGAPGGTTQMILVDRNGNPIWRVDVGVTETTGFVAQNRGKIMWVDGITLQSIPTNVIILVTIN